MPPSGPSNSTGILLFSLGMVSFATGDTMLKVALRTYSLEQSMMIRMALMVLVALAVAHFRGSVTRAFRSGQPWMQVARGGVLLLDTIGFSLALGQIGLSGAHSIYSTVPLFVTALAVPLLGEKVGWRRWSAVAVGFAGALLIIQPGSGVFHTVALFALGGAFFGSLYSIFTRIASRTDPPETSIFFVALIGFICFAPFGIWKWVQPDLTGILLFAGMTVASLIGHTCVIRALTRTEATVLQPFQYVVLATATTYGVLIFNEQIEPLKLLGTAIVVASGLYVAWREFVLSRRSRFS